MVNIIVVFRKLDDAKKIRSILQRHGFTVTACCSTGLQAIGLFDDLRNGIVICGYQMTDMLYTEIRENLPEDFQMLLMARENLLPQLVDNDLVCLPMPARAGDLVQTVAMMQNAVEIRIKKRKSRPKALLMARNNMTEPEAHRYIQKTAMDTGTSLVETAQMVLDLFSL